jgi:L-lactate dehydrogenase complex protein LldG
MVGQASAGAAYARCAAYACGREVFKPDRESGEPEMTASTEARAIILSRIAGPAAGATDLSAEYASLPREYARKGALDRDARINMLEHRLRDYDAGVYRCAREALPQTVAEVLAARGKARMAIPAGLPAAWLPLGFSFLMAEEFSPRELDGVDGLLSGCTVAIAETGTLVLQNAPGQGARRLSLVPDYHLCVVDAGQVVETVPEAFAVLEPTKCLPTTFISGPSATADIEMTRIKGVHGPRFLDVILTFSKP